MLDEIIKLREDGLSFRKIASQLNTTVGRVQYRWNKWINNQENQGEDCSIEENSVKADIIDSQSEVKYVPIKGELHAKLITPRKVIVYWEVSKIPEKVITSFFNKPIEELVYLVRIYDVTDIIFNGKNAHHFYDISVPYNNGYWFIKGLTVNRSYVTELGVKLNDNEFFPVLRSNCVQTPAMGLSHGSEIYHTLVHYQQLEDSSPKWIDHVSTYSYYAESKNMENKNE